MRAYTLHHGDCLEVMRAMPDNSVDAIVTDPPYGLEFMGKEWDAPWKGDNRQPGDDSYTESASRHSNFVRYGMSAGYGGDLGAKMRGFQDWTEQWAREVLRVLKPGGHLLAFSGSRTYHRMACAIEDAGFEIRDQIMWLYGSGFPKSLDVSKAIDKAAGAERERVPGPKSGGMASYNAGNAKQGYRDEAYYEDGNTMLSKEPATDAARQWNGWGTAMKPAHEPICMARKPLVGTVAANVLQFGTGAINVDACRVQTDDNLNGGAYSAERKPSDSEWVKHGGTIHSSTGREFVQPTGRWPANVVHDGSDEVVGLFPAQAGAAAPVHTRNSDKFRNAYGAFAGDVDEAGSTFHGDSGSAARFFYCAKATRRDRNEGCEQLDKRPLLWSSGTQNPGSFQSKGTDKSSQNHHPTVKPTALMQWLVRLVTPPGGTVLDPFMGSGSTGKACVLEGVGFIGIEREADYLSIAEARIAHARQQVLQAAAKGSAQLGLFGEDAA